MLRDGITHNRELRWWSDLGELYACEAGSALEVVEIGHGARGARRSGLSWCSVSEAAMTNEALTLQLLAWIGEKPRNYAETIDAWRGV